MAGFREIMQSVGGLNDTPRSSMDVICWRMAAYGGVRNRICYQSVAFLHGQNGMISTSDNCLKEHALPYHCGCKGKHFSSKKEKI